MTDDAPASTDLRGERSGRREQNKAENRTALLKAKEIYDEATIRAWMESQVLAGN